MNKSIIGFLAFVVGTGAGFALAARLTKDKYAQIAQDEIDSVKAAFRREHPPVSAKKSAPANRPTPEERRAYSRYAHDLGYSEDPKPAPVQKPRVIKPDEFGDQDGYDEISLTYYADGTVADDADHPMSESDIEESIGRESLKHFGEYEEDSVFVRNDRLKADYEILADRRTYADILREKPYLAR